LVLTISEQGLVIIYQMQPSKKILEALDDALAEKFPGYGIIVNEEEFKRTGSTDRTTIGYRYMVQFGIQILSK
jgi:hypothetical protein